MPEYEIDGFVIETDVTEEKMRSAVKAHRRYCAEFVSKTLGIGVSYARSRYTSDEQSRKVLLRHLLAEAQGKSYDDYMRENHDGNQA